MKKISRTPDPLEIQLRTATLEDLDEIVKIENACFDAPWPTSALLDEIEKSISVVVVASIKSSIVGFMVYWKVDTERHLLNFATHPSSRRKGVGRKMLTHLLDNSKHDGTSQISLEVRISNTPARDLYQNYGFYPVAIRPRYYADNGEDALLMILDMANELTTCGN